MRHFIMRNKENGNMVVVKASTAADLHRLLHVAAREDLALEQDDQLAVKQSDVDFTDTSFKPRDYFVSVTKDGAQWDECFTVVESVIYHPED